MILQARAVLQESVQAFKTSTLDFLLRSIYHFVVEVIKTANSRFKSFACLSETATLETNAVFRECRELSRADPRPQ